MLEIADIKLVRILRLSCNLANLPKPVFVLATAMVVIFAAIIVTRLPFDNQNMVNGYLGEQMAFFTYLDSDELDYYDDEDYAGLGTSIEEYFF